MAKALVDNREFIENVAENRKSLEVGNSINTSVQFTDKNFHNAIGKADILDMHINKNGKIDLLVTDVYDFNDDKNASDLIKTGRNRQEKGEIKPYFYIYHVIIPQNAKLNERQKKILIDNLIKILKNDIFIFFVLGTIVSIIELNHINWYNNYYLKDSSARIDFIYSTITFMLFYHYIPFYLSIILNLIIKFSKNEIVKKVFKIIMIIINIISVLYLGFLTLFICTLDVPTQS